MIGVSNLGVALTTAFKNAIAAAGRATKSLLEIDFTGSWADYSPYLSQWTLDRSITTDVPEGAKTVTGYATTQLTAQAIGDPSDNALHGAAFWSPFQPTSPIYGYTRLNRPIRVSAGFAVQNLIGNNSFETDTSGWSGLNGATLSRIAGGTDGAWQCRVTSTVASPPTGIIAGIVNGIVAGGQYEVTAWINPSITRTMTANIDWYTAAGAYISTTSSSKSIAAGSWQSLETTHTAPALAAQAIVYFDSGNTTIGAFFDIDTISLRPLSEANRPVSYVNRFTGFIRSVRVSATDRVAEIVGVDNWDILKNKVTLPIAARAYSEGAVNMLGNLWASWVAEYTLRQAGVFASPPPGPNTRLSVLAHGSLWPDIGTPWSKAPSNCGTMRNSTAASVGGDSSTLGNIVEYLASGVYSGGVRSQALSLDTRGISASLVPDPGGTAGSGGVAASGGAGLNACWKTSQIVSVLPGRGMTLEVWVDLSNPQGIAAADCLWSARVGNQNGVKWACGVTGDRRPFAFIDSGAGGGATQYFTAVGAADWTYFKFIFNNISATSATVDCHVAAYNGTLANRGQKAFTLGYGSTETSQFTTVQLRGLLIGESTTHVPGVRARWECLMLHEGGDTTYSSAGNPYFNFAPEAMIDRSWNQLLLVPELDPDITAAEVLQGIATAENATTGFDERGSFWFFNRYRWSRPPATTPSIAVASSKALKTLDVNHSTDQIRNKITASVTTADLQASQIVYQRTTGWGIHSHANRSWLVDLDNPCVAVDTGDYNNQIPNVSTGAPSTSGWHANRQPDGSGVSVTALVYVSVIQTKPRQLKVIVANGNNFPVYFITDDSGPDPDKPGISVRARPFIMDSNDLESTDSTSIAKYGQREWGISSSEWLQLDPDDDVPSSLPQSILDDYLSQLKDPTQVLENVSIMADPRLQLGDRITIVDSDSVNASIDAWIQGIQDSWVAEAQGSDGVHSQALTLRVASAVPLEVEAPPQNVVGLAGAGTFLTGQSGSTSSVTAPVAVPPEVQIDDVIAVVLYNEHTTGTSITKPNADWVHKLTTTVTFGGNTMYLSLFYCRVTEANFADHQEGLTYNFSWTTGSWREAQAYIVRNAIATGDPFRSTVTATDSTGVNVNTPSVTLNSLIAGDGLLWACCNWDTRATTAPDTWNLLSLPDGRTFGAAWRVKAIDGTTGGIQGSVSAASEMAALMVAIKHA